MTTRFTDALGKNLAFAVLRKENRLQILYRPRKKQVRERGKKGWSLLAAIDFSDGHSNKGLTERQLLDNLLEGFLNDISGQLKSPKIEKVKKKNAKDTAASPAI